MAHKVCLMPWFPCSNSTPLHSLYELSAKCLEDLSRKREAAVRITLDDLRTRQDRVNFANPPQAPEKCWHA
jgi:hypothetical protein